MAQAAATRAVIGVDSANRRQLLFSATDREFLIHTNTSPKGSVTMITADS